jgi:hypothetical protein
VDHLSRGFEVELVTRGRALPFAAGPRQRLAILETLALIEAQPTVPEPLRASDSRARQLRVGGSGEHGENNQVVAVAGA